MTVSDVAMAPPSVPADDDSTDGFVTVRGEVFYRIRNFHQMPPFLMSIVSNADHWLYLSSNGGLTAGRVNEDGALFPYVTDDKLHLAHYTTGPITLLRIHRPEGAPLLYQPFFAAPTAHALERNLYKNVPGNRVIFEEINQTLGLTFRYEWVASDAFGFVRTVTLQNHADADAVKIEVLDGLLNLLPAGTSLTIQQSFSCLINAYTRAEVDRHTGLGIYALSSLIVDQAKPAEALRANIAYACGLTHYQVHLAPETVQQFRQHQPLRAADVSTGRGAAYLVTTTVELAPDQTLSWRIIADVDRTQGQVEALRHQFLHEAELDAAIAEDLAAGDADLRRNVASADGLQTTADTMASAHHFVNVLFNNMRGGIFADGYALPANDFVNFLQTRNTQVSARHAKLLTELNDTLDYRELITEVKATNDSDLLRLTLEYLPLTFGRRHGDPSRPWNRFAIRIKNADGSRALNYQGNWRDIFQNWEAMARSFPDYIESIISKFVNASTVDGFNPYRITRDGIDWETPNPEDPWSNIGYWGDHQIIYLLKFLEASAAHHPGQLQRLLLQPLYTYADVPYRLKPYAEILQQPRDTIAFDRALAARIDKRKNALGTDGKLLPTSDGSVYHVTLLEKLLVPVLAKLSNLVLDAGIWMNTQRPEWNDANNALVGNGVSMVTLCYLHRYLDFCLKQLASCVTQCASVSQEVVSWFAHVANVLQRNQGLLDTDVSDDHDRKRVLDALGEAFSDYRQEVYAHGLSGQSRLPVADVAAFFTLAQRYLQHAIRANRRPDGLYHAYNLLRISPDGSAAKVEHLQEMLEGQVAVLSSGVLSPEEAADLLEALFASAMYRPDQNSFLLYPNRKLPGFLEKNIVAPERTVGNPLLSALLQAGDKTIITKDAFGQIRFAAGLRAADDLEKTLTELGRRPEWNHLVHACRSATLETFEQVFGHHRFTGRSGSMYGYEGLGCIYWHMVAKLLLATQENFRKAERAGSSATGRLSDIYYRVRAGLGFNKSAREYGAFPTDPYSHTPGHSGAQQPGMTGQVKEEILTRMGELGVAVEDGRLTFRPTLLRHSEFFQVAQTFTYLAIDGQSRTIELPADALAFTYCQTPIVYQCGANEPELRVVKTNGTVSRIAGLTLDQATSQAIFGRAGSVERLEIRLAL